MIGHPNILGIPHIHEDIIPAPHQSLKVFFNESIDLKFCIILYKEEEAFPRNFSGQVKIFLFCLLLF